MHQSVLEAVSSCSFLRDATDEWLREEAGPEEAGRACTALIALRDGEQYTQEHRTSLVTIRDSRLRAEWQAMKKRRQLPTGVPRSSRYYTALQEDDPKAAPNEVLGVRTVTDPTSPVLGQKESYFRRACAKGTMMPFVGELLPPTETNGYEFDFPLGNVGAVNQPDLRTAVPYTNDFAGEDRRDSNKTAKRSLLNVEIAVAHDAWKRPYLFLRTTKGVDQGDTAWMDYGAPSHTIPRDTAAHETSTHALFDSA